MSGTKFTDEFKRDAVAQVVDRGYPVREVAERLGYEAGSGPPSGQANRRNGGTTKRVKGQDGEMPLTVPRDRDGSFESELVKKGQTRIDGIDDKSEPLMRH